MNLIIQEKNQHSNLRRPSADPTAVMLQTSKSWRKMLRDLKRDVKRKGNFSWLFWACPIWWRGESVNCEYVCTEIQQLPLSVGVPSDGVLTSSWRTAISCTHEVEGSDPEVHRAEKWDMTVTFFPSLRIGNLMVWSDGEPRRLLWKCVLLTICYIHLSQGSNIHKTQSP